MPTKVIERNGGKVYSHCREGEEPWGEKELDLLEERVLPFVAESLGEPKYNVKADNALYKLYCSNKAFDDESKIELLMNLLGGQHGFSKNPTPQTKLACLEYNFLLEKGLINVQFT